MRPRDYEDAVAVSALGPAGVGLWDWLKKGLLRVKGPKLVRQTHHLRVTVGLLGLVVRQLSGVFMFEACCLGVGGMCGSSPPIGLGLAAA